MTTTATAVIDAKAEEIADKLPQLEASMNYTLADAIREGASFTDQCVGEFTGPAGEMCALSAALTAVKARHML